MNVFILTDLEGIAGVCDIDYMDRTGEKYRLARHYLCESINIAASACFSAGADNVYYLDGHGGGGNVIDELIDSRAVKCTASEWQKLLESGKIDCQIELGAHARAGTLGGFLDHTTNSRRFFSLTVNGDDMSELSVHALVCAAYGVPVVACIGDEAVCSQAKEYIPDIFTGAVKKASCRNYAETYENADEILKNTIKNALSGYKNVSIMKIKEPAEISLTYYRTDMCEEAFENCRSSAIRTGARTLSRTVEHISKYEDFKF